MATEPLVATKGVATKGAPPPEVGRSSEVQPLDTYIVVGETLLCVGTLGLWGLGGLYTVGPRETRIVLHMGKLTEVQSEPGLHWRPSFGREDRIATTADISFLVPEQKVVDTEGVPIMVAAVLVYRIVDARKAVLDIDNVHRYVQAQASAVLKLTVSRHSYDTLKVESANVQQQVVELLQEKTIPAGVEIVSVTLSELNYAPEIASAMLKKQQAAALVSARELIVEGACSICADAVRKLEAHGMTLDQADKIKIVTNLLTVVCGEENATPMINVSS